MTARLARRPRSPLAPSRRSRVAAGVATLALLAAAASTLVGQPADAIPSFVEIPAGTVAMGADPADDPDAFDNERWPSSGGDRTVPVPAFAMTRHEITVAEFTAFARAGVWPVDRRALDAPPTHPVAFVSWTDALAYCRWLERTLRASPAAPAPVRERLGQGWRITLPSEAEWERAARGPDRRRYPWGDEPLRTRANYGSGGPGPVGRFACPECPFGLADLSGNVWEWTRSPYQPYPYDPRSERGNLDADALYVIRGGGYADDARMIRTTARGGAEPGARRPFIGFRVVAVPRSRER